MIHYVRLIGFILFFIFNCALATEQLIIEPDDGRAPILSEVHNAKSTIDLVMYGFTDGKILKALIKAKKSGKDVEIILEPSPYKSENENHYAIEKLQKAHIALQTPHIKLTHQKTFIIDHQKAIVMTFNLTHSSFKKERNFAIVIDDPEEVKEISEVFDLDSGLSKKPNILKTSNLVWSPDNSREKIKEFIKDATTDIKIYAQDLSDYQIIGTLAKAARSGKKVQIIMSDPPPEQAQNKIKYLQRAGVIFHFNKNYMIHAKVIIVDNDRAILGSINLTKPSLNENRELSVITHDKNVVDNLVKIFQSDS